MSSETPERDRGRALVLAVLFIAVAVLTAVDLTADLRQGTTAVHVLVEGAVAALGLVGGVWMISQAHALRGEAQELRARSVELSAQVEASRRDAERWRGEVGDLIAGLGAAIDRQLERWQLSVAEREVALLLLKGLSHKEIAEIRQVNEATVRQQARALYRKAGLTGRHDLAAFFLEDLLGPRPDRVPSTI